MSRRIVDVIKEEDLLKLLKAEKNNKKRLAYVLGFYQCMRISEIVGLRKEISNCCKGEIEIIKEKPIIRLCPVCQRDVPLKDIRRSKTEWKIPPLTKEHIDLEGRKVMLKNAKGGKDRTIALAPEVVRFLKYLPVGGGIRALQVSIKKTAMKVLNKDIHPHTLRASGATHYMDKGWPTRYLQEFLGHSKLDTTQLYLKINPKDQIDKMWEGIEP